MEDKSGVEWILAIEDIIEATHTIFYGEAKENRGVVGVVRGGHWWS